MMNDMICRICRLRAVDGGAQLLVEIEVTYAGVRQRETLCLLAARLERMPVVGEISPETVSEMRHEDRICAAIGAGLRMLGSNGCSAKYLVEKLRMRGFDSGVAAEAAQILAEKGYLHEEQGALREAERGLAKLWGDRRILADLSAKGYNGSALKYAAARLRTEDGGARCAALLRKRRVRPPRDEAELRRLLASLSRYGYSSEEIRAGLQELKK